MSRYWHPHRTERQYIKLGDAFWQEAHFDGYLVTITSDDEADENICGCQHMEQAQRVAEAYNKAKAYDDIIRQIERGSFDASEALAFYNTNQDKAKP